MSTFRARAVISTEAIRRNFDAVRSVAGVEAMAVVKADAYGHGVEHIAPVLREHGVRWLGVALPSEAIALRSAGDAGNVLAWLSTPGDPHIAECVALGVDLSVSSIREFTDIVTAAQAQNVVANIHIKIDTGLSRNGIGIGDLESLIPLVQKARNVHVRGVWSHLASADHEDLAYSQSSVAQQVGVFEAALELLAANGINPDIRHVANTAGALWHPSTHYDLVRVGIGTYGLSPNTVRATAAELGLVPAMHLQARLSNTKTIPAGAGVSYSHTWIAETATRIGLVPIGYADGIPRNLGNRIEFAIGGKRVKQIGTIAMDQCVVELSGVPDTEPGAVVDLFGSGASGELTADDWGQRMETVGYEIVTRIGTRVPKEYA
jgi:alanine racemase